MLGGKIYEVISLEFEFTVSSSNNHSFNFELNDSIIDYKHMREHLSESMCIEVIQKIKQISNKRCALIFGNCQTDKIRRILMNHMQFRREFFFIKLPPVYMINERDATLIFGGGGGSFYN